MTSLHRSARARYRPSRHRSARPSTARPALPGSCPGARRVRRAPSPPPRTCRRVGDDGGAERGGRRLAAAGMLPRELPQRAARGAVVVVVGGEVGQQVQGLRRARVGGPSLRHEAQLCFAFRRPAIPHHGPRDAVSRRRRQRLRLRHLPVLRDRVLVASQAEQHVGPVEAVLGGAGSRREHRGIRIRRAGQRARRAVLRAIVSCWLGVSGSSRLSTRSAAPRAGAEPLRSEMNATSSVPSAPAARCRPAPPGAGMRPAAGRRPCTPRSRRSCPRRAQSRARYARGSRFRTTVSVIDAASVARFVRSVAVPTARRSSQSRTSGSRSAAARYPALALS